MRNKVKTVKMITWVKIQNFHAEMAEYLGRSWCNNWRSKFSFWPVFTVHWSQERIQKMSRNSGNFSLHEQVQCCSHLTSLKELETPHAPAAQEVVSAVEHWTSGQDKRTVFVPWQGWQAAALSAKNRQCVLKHKAISRDFWWPCVHGGNKNSKPGRAKPQIDNGCWFAPDGQAGCSLTL